MRVMVVDDTQQIAEMLALALEIADVEVTTWTSEFAVLLTPDPWRGVDAAVIDLMLPGMDGEDIVRYLAAEHPTVQRVVLSAVAHQRPGLDEFATCISKPVDPRTLLHVLGVRHDS